MTLLGQGQINILFGQIPQLPSNFLVRQCNINFSKAQASYQVFQKVIYSGNKNKNITYIWVFGENIT